MLPSTHDRVPSHTAGAINARLRADTLATVAHLAGDVDAIDRRLAELDREWDVERALEANAATLALAGVLLAGTLDRRWLVLPGVVAAFLLQHALQGWCPPLPVLRRAGFRTADEIAEERYALKLLRGDLVAPAPDASPVQQARHALAVVRI